MNTTTTQHESISALADGELSDAQLDAVLASLHAADKRQTWEIYHQIGDVLRSDDLAVNLSPDFSSRFSAMLDAEPTILAPNAQAKESQQGLSRRANYFGLAALGMAAAAMFALVLAPQLQPTLDGASVPAIQIGKAPQGEASVQLASGSGKTEMPVKSANPAAAATGDAGKGAEEQPDMLRDPRIDSYLMAHQRFSPAISNGTQYVTRANAVSSASEK